MSNPRDPAYFRHVMGYFPTGVVVVTASGAKGPIGMSIGSFGSVSLDPPLVMFMPTTQSASWAQIQQAGHFGVNILAADQAAISEHFAVPGAEQFQGLSWSTKTTGAPILTSTQAWVDCQIDRVIDAGDHCIVLGLVLDLGTQSNFEDNNSVSFEPDPLIFLGGKYGSFQR